MSSSRGDLVCMCVCNGQQQHQQRRRRRRRSRRRHRDLRRRPLWARARPGARPRAPGDEPAGAKRRRGAAGAGAGSGAGGDGSAATSISVISTSNDIGRLSPGAVLRTTRVVDLTSGSGFGLSQRQTPKAKHHMPNPKRQILEGRTATRVRRLTEASAVGADCPNRILLSVGVLLHRGVD